MRRPGTGGLRRLRLPDDPRALSRVHSASDIAAGSTKASVPVLPIRQARPTFWFASSFAIRSSQGWLASGRCVAGWSPVRFAGQTAFPSSDPVQRAGLGRVRTPPTARSLLPTARRLATVLSVCVSFFPGMKPVGARPVFERPGRAASGGPRSRSAKADPNPAAVDLRSAFGRPSRRRGVAASSARARQRKVRPPRLQRAGAGGSGVQLARGASPSSPNAGGFCVRNESATVGLDHASSLVAGCVVAAGRPSGDGQTCGVGRRVGRGRRG